MPCGRFGFSARWALIGRYSIAQQPSGRCVGHQHQSHLGREGPDGVFDPYGVTINSRFSMAYNDWGLKLDYHPQLGLGGDINGGFAQGH